MHPSFRTSAPARLHPLAVSLAIAFACTAPRLHAATFEGTILVEGVPIVVDGPAASVSGFVSTTQQINSTFQGDVSTGFSRVSAAAATVPSAASAGSTLVFRQMVTNPFATAQNVAFNFVIPRSRTSIDLGFDTNLQSFTAAASFAGDISWGGASVWNIGYGVQGSGSVALGSASASAFGPNLSASASGFTVSGFYSDVGLYTNEPLTGIAGYAQLESDEYTGRLELGVLQAGQSVELTYTLSASAMFQGTYRDGSQAGAYGYGELAQAGGFDPFGIDFTPDAGGIQFEFSPAPIPEPSTYALLAGGLGVLAWATRRRRAAGQQ